MTVAAARGAYLAALRAEGWLDSCGPGQGPPQPAAGVPSIDAYDLTDGKVRRFVVFCGTVTFHIDGGTTVGDEDPHGVPYWICRDDAGEVREVAAGPIDEPGRYWRWA